MANLVEVAYRGYSTSATFTPAAASHVAGNSVGGAKEFVLNAPPGERIKILSARLLINSTAAQATAWRLYLFNVTPPSALADDAAFLLAAGDQASYLGFIDLGVAADVGSTQVVETNNINKPIKLADNTTSIFGYLVNLSTLTTPAVSHIVTLHAI